MPGGYEREVRREITLRICFEKISKISLGGLANGRDYPFKSLCPVRALFEVPFSELAASFAQAFSPWLV